MRFTNFLPAHSPFTADIFHRLILWGIIIMALGEDFIGSHGGKFSLMLVALYGWKMLRNVISMHRENMETRELLLAANESIIKLQSDQAVLLQAHNTLSLVTPESIRFAQIMTHADPEVKQILHRIAEGSVDFEGKLPTLPRNESPESRRAAFKLVQKATSPGKKV
jgi:hypothetical protein